MMKNIKTKKEQQEYRESHLATHGLTLDRQQAGIKAIIHRYYRDFDKIKRSSSSDKRLRIDLTLYKKEFHDLIVGINWILGRELKFETNNLAEARLFLLVECVDYLLLIAGRLNYMIERSLSGLHNYDNAVSSIRQIADKVELLSFGKPMYYELFEELHDIGHNPESFRN